MMVQYTTTTIAITQPTAPTLSSSHQPIPVAAIVGGIIGGGILATLATAIWVCWGKSLKRKRLKERLEAESHLQTLRNTQRNASAPQQHSHSHRPLITQLPETKIRFANVQRTNEDDAKVTISSTSQSKRLPESSRDPTKPKRLRRTNPPSKPVLNEVEKGSVAPAHITSVSGTVANKLSTNSLGSTYMTASEEIDQTTAGQPGNEVDSSDNLESSFQRYFRKKSRQEMQRQSISTYGTALSRLFDDDDDE
ncbi:hypothetical protein AX15_006133 [Amanita polypyramis BW_CC]|nr:hypothetical protein AX15_006133 [Amanita polypyramis BW_CC]